MTRIKRFFIPAIMSLFLLSPADFALGQDEVKQVDIVVSDISTDTTTEEIDHRREIFNLMQKMSESLNEQQQRHFFITYNNYNIIKTVTEVQSDVSNAIAACSKNNPDMKAKLTARFQLWNNVVNPVVKEAEINLNNMILAQNYAPEKDIREILNAVDQVRIVTNSQIKKIPVTTPEACEYLHNKMSETEKDLTSLLTNTLVALPRSLPYSQPLSEDKLNSTP